MEKDKFHQNENSRIQMRWLSCFSEINTCIYKYKPVLYFKMLLNTTLYTVGNILLAY